MILRCLRHCRSSKVSGSRARSARGSIGDGQCVRMSEALRSIGFLFPLVGLGTGASPVVLVGKWWLKMHKRCTKLTSTFFPKGHHCWRVSLALLFVVPRCSQLSPVLGESPELESIVVSRACPLQYPRYKGLHIPVTIHLLIFQQKCFEEFAGPPHAWIVKTCKFQGSSQQTLESVGMARIINSLANPLRT